MNLNKLIIVRNKLALYCGVFILSFILCLLNGDYVISGIIAALFVILSIISFMFINERRLFMRTLAIILLVSAIGIGYAIGAKCVYYYPSVRFLEKYQGEECRLLLRIDKIDSSGDSYANYNCSILECNGDKTESFFGIHPSMRLNCFGGDFALKGDIVYVNTKISAPEKETKDGFEEANYLKSRHIFINADYNGEMTLVKAGEQSAFSEFRKKLSGNITKYIGTRSVKDETVIAKCMLFGDKTGVSKELKAIFRAAGISHVLSVSGLHLSILFMVISIVFGLRKRTPRRRFVYAELVTCILVFTYMALANFTPSIMRAGFMIIFMNIFSAAMFYKRRFGKDTSGVFAPLDTDGISHDSGVYYYPGDEKDKTAAFDSVSALFCAGALIIVISPYSVFDVGMQLSFMSTLGILIAVCVLLGFEDRIKNPVLRFVLTSFFITFSAVSFTVPICVYNFGQLSTMSAFSNLLVTPVMTPLLALLLVLALMSLLPPIGIVTSVCTFIGWLCELLCSFCIAVARFNSGFLFSVIDTQENIFYTIIFILVAVITVVSLFLGLKNIKAVGFFALMCLYFIFYAVSFFGTVKNSLIPSVSLCTVNKRPYLCVSVMDTRIIIDNTCAIGSDSVIRSSMGNELYDTKNVYLVLTDSDSELYDAYFNIMYLNKSERIHKVLLPSGRLSALSGTDMTEYSTFVKRLDEEGFELGFYENEFSIDDMRFKAEVSEFGWSFVFEDYCVIYADEYNETYADSVSKDSDYCIYFCDNAAQTDNLGYNSNAQLYVSSPLYKNVRGAKQIPTGRPVLLE